MKKDHEFNYYLKIKNNNITVINRAINKNKNDEQYSAKMIVSSYILYLYHNILLLIIVIVIVIASLTVSSC
jgi:hypothetical protein